MNGREPSQGDGLFPSFRTAANLMAFLAEMLAASVLVFTRTGLGPRYLGLQAAAAVVAIPCFSVFFPYEDARPLLWFLLAYLGMCLLCRIGTQIRLARGIHVHSRYNGRPLLSRVLPWLSETAIKAAVEPASVLMLGALVAEWSLPLGSYLMLSAAGLAVSAALIAGYERQRAMDMFDAFTDQGVIAERFRQMRGIRMRF
jgi:hypothetical protein